MKKLFSVLYIRRLPYWNRPVNECTSPSCHGFPVGAENIKFYATLRGFRAGDIDALVAAVGTHLDMAKHMHKIVRDYSGGTRRKLSFIVACIGDPTIVFLGTCARMRCRLGTSVYFGTALASKALPREMSQKGNRRENE